MKSRFLISGALIAALVATNAQAIELYIPRGGTAVLNRGGGYFPVSTGAILNPGDRVRAQGVPAFIRYDNGCTTQLGPRQVGVVSAEPPACAPLSVKDPVQTVAPVVEEPSINPLAAGLLLGSAVAVAAVLATNNNGGGSSPLPHSP